ncbi:MAG: zinc-binding dehydrogenase [Anaerolineales bacterium]|nr:zinc-binding dehydrogenase [Anaerolineales bacterium]
MKAVLFRQHGGAEVLEYTDFPAPEPKKLKPVIDRTYPLKDAAPAQERLWRNENFGKITLDIY